MSGTGRVWPLLTGERGHYELAAGRDTGLYLRTMEALASKTGLLCEQSWDEADRPEIHMYLGRPTGSAMPLMWAHAEYVKLLRSTADKKMYDMLPEVAARYQGDRKGQEQWEIWKPSRKVRFMKPGAILRFQADAAFRLHWSADAWKTVQDLPSVLSAFQISYADVNAFGSTPGARIDFTLYWVDANQWEGVNYNVTVR